jgi:hypothetical protein
MRILRTTAIAAAVLLVAAQFVRLARTNPPVEPARAFHARVEMPAEVRAIVARACRDCHSHETRWPWYSRVAPVSWLLTHHVNHGRQHLNFSHWDGDAEKTGHALEEICEEVRGGAMPLRSYLLLHHQARLSEDDVRTLCAWSEAARARLASR